MVVTHCELFSLTPSPGFSMVHDLCEFCLLSKHLLTPYCEFVTSCIMISSVLKFVNSSL